MKKKIAILGSTGSIGTSTVKIIEQHPEKFAVTSLAANSNIELIEKQARQFQPKLIAIKDERRAKELRKRLPKFKIVSGEEGLQEACIQDEIDIVVVAVTGSCGLLPTLAAIEAKKTIAIANKETLVAFGSLVTSRAKKNKVDLLPLDSEHNAIFQCLQGENRAAIKRLILTCSGGPFLGKTADELEHIQVEAALKHPNWEMGKKISIDSSTLMNKGLELIEAHYLFDLDISKIDVVIHPQSIVHSMVEFIDHSIIAQMGYSDMILPIQYALSYPERIQGFLPSLDFTKMMQLDFLPVDRKTFRCLDLAFNAIKAGGSLPCYMNAANEKLVARFIRKEINWKDIAGKLEKLMQKHQNIKDPDLEVLIETDLRARHEAGVA